jgi:hypothetical protein
MQSLCTSPARQKPAFTRPPARKGGRAMLNDLEFPNSLTDLAARIMAEHYAYVAAVSSGGLIEQFIEKLLVERHNFVQAIVLVHNRTDAAWFHTLCSIADAIAFTIGRVGFYDKDGEPSSPANGSVLVYIGERPEDFAEAFSDNCSVLPFRGRRPSNARAAKLQGGPRHAGL